MNRINPLGGAPIDPNLGRTTPSGKTAPSDRTGKVEQSAPPSQGLQKPETSDFRKILDKQVERDQAVRFSAHALSRLDSRNIQFSAESMSKLAEAVDRAESKGAREALVLMPGAERTDDLALVVSVKNRTVITAVDGANIQDNVFTNIDSAVVAR
jgi:flagellar operon protein